MNSAASFGRCGTQTFVAGLKCDGLVAPWIVNAPMNRAIFDTYVETQLAPVLQPKDLVILDNLSSHKSARAESILRSRGALFLFLPPYSPDFNPIKMAFSKLKAHLRKKPPEPLMNSGTQSVTSVHSSQNKSVQTTSPLPDMDSIESAML